MLKSTQNPITKEQFTRLRDARRLIKEQFHTEFSLQTDDVIHELYAFAVRSDSNELFRLFTDLNANTENPVENPLDEEQFILLREAKALVDSEFGEVLELIDRNVMDQLYALALRSSRESLFDIYMYLSSRPEQFKARTRATSGTYFVKLRQAGRLVHEQFGDTIALHEDTALSELAAHAERSNNGNLVDIVAWLENWQPDELSDSELWFPELSAPDFERLREAKTDIFQEFGETFSLHADSTLDDLYDFALRAADTKLFELFCDLLGPQSAARKVKSTRGWFSREQFMLLRSAREVIKAEFEETLDLQSPTLQSDLFQYALRAEEEGLFELCWEFQQLRSPVDRATALPSKEEFRMLRHARALIQKEFGAELQLQSEAVEYELYRYAVNSEHDELFDLFTELMALPGKSTERFPADAPGLLEKEEYTALRKARRQIMTEFGEQLALADADVLDRLYGYALESESETLFDLHAELNARAAQEEPSPAATATTTGAVSTEEPPSEAVYATGNAGQAPPRPLERLMMRWLPGRDQESTAPAPEETEDKLTPARDTAAQAEERSEAPEEKGVEHASFADLVVRAVEISPSNKTPEGATQISQSPRRQNKLPRGRRSMQQSSFSPNRPATAVNVQEVTLPADATANEERDAATQKSWYVSTLDERLKVRLSGRLSVGMDGELVIAAPDDIPASAIIELVADRPVVFARDEALAVNDLQVETRCELTPGDTIAVAGTVLQISHDFADTRAAVRATTHQSPA